jgi:hypothetical protein
MAQKRKEPRKVYIARAKVMWKESNGYSLPISALIEDTSASGMSIRIKQEISVGCMVEIQWHKQQLQGVVVNCRKDGFEYILGVHRDLENESSVHPG